MQRVKIEEPQHQLKGNTSLKAGLTLVVVVENGEVAPDVVAQFVEDEDYIALTPHPTGRDADGRMLFLTPDAGKALLLVLRYSFEAGGGASFTFTLVARCSLVTRVGSEEVRVLVSDP